LFVGIFVAFLSKYKYVLIIGTIILIGILAMVSTLNENKETITKVQKTEKIIEKVVTKELEKPKPKIQIKEKVEEKPTIKKMLEVKKSEYEISKEKQEKEYKIQKIEQKNDFDSFKSNIEDEFNNL